MSLSSLLAPITLPIASLFAIPMLSSWSTSLNLVFFSLTWTTIAITYSPLQLEFFAPLFLRTFLYLLPSGLFLLFDLLLPSLAVELKAQGEIGLPARQKGGARKVRRVVGWACFNSILAVAVQAGVEWLVTDVLRMRSLLLIKGSAWTLNHLPNPWTLFKHSVLGLVLRNTLQYYIHLYILHSPSGGIFAHWHQTWHHSIQLPYSFVAAYDHPACYLLYRFIPLYLPAVAFRFHIMTYLLLLALFSLEEVFTYSGYNVLPSTIMLRGMARRTDAHMMSQGKGNYGPIGVLDWAHGTTLGADVMDDMRDEMEKHNVQERTGRAIDQAGDATNGLGTKLKNRARKGRGRK
ncbi:uncharacterized protein BDR25DRAFT_323503 [Lindgomyces ingoldianus]|uniref:Uncharacterized protein n=1 Tax=Lindgomyces ingoldianus TaxID=673940 RepID=A0ACB6R3F4_9PLEO|nr:uncharacterized protein BDR25DRAFT_323503 [Lindgomyces ingoldianus]KAF2473788.1 hypothetical protein BDR25DRAFT_323503 [Lindgomyces ingoldianus]